MHLFVLIYYGKIEDHDCVDRGLGNLFDAK